MLNVDLNEIAVFVEVAKTGSFTAAAKALNMPNSTVSAKVSSLERRLGLTLIQRTTRQLNLTQPGRDYFQRCLQAIGEIENAEAEVSSLQGEPRGLFKITAPPVLGTALLTDVVSNFSKTYPKVQIELILSDRVVDLVSEGVDLAIRGGELKDSGLIMKKLGTSYFAPFASPAYLKKFGTPKHPKDLREHQCLQFSSLTGDGWEFTNDRSRVNVSVEPRIIADDLNMVKYLAIKGDGIALLPTFLCGLEAKSGKLARVLPEWISNRRPVNFVYPSQKFTNKKIEAFMNATTEPLRALLKAHEI